jgi:predicted small secreted protein
MKRSDWAVVLAMVLCAAVLAACSSSGAGGSGGGASKEEASLEFAECMRAHGVEMEDPKPGHSIEVGDPNDPTTKKALAACNGKLGAGQELTSEEDEELKEGALAFAQCMREEGIDMGDPTFLGPGKFHLDIAGLDTNSPAFEAAQEACQGKMPELNLTGVGG